MALQFFLQVAFHYAHAKLDLKFYLSLLAWVFFNTCQIFINCFRYNFGVKFFALFGLGYIYKDKLSGKHISTIAQLKFHCPLTLIFFHPFHLKKFISKTIRRIFPSVLHILFDKIALSVRSLPYISKSTSKVNHLIAQSTFH